ncbi:MAG: EAL domain-containing protein [Rhodospirillales bacterium]
MSAEDELLAFWRRRLKDQERHVVIAIRLAELFMLHESPQQFRIQRGMIIDLAERRGARSYEMPNRDLVLSFRPRDAADADETVVELLDWVLKDAALPDDAIQRRVEVFKLPDRLNELRQMILRYAGMRETDAPIQTLARADAASTGDAGFKGPLVHTMLDRLEHVIMGSDIRPFVERQAVFAKPDDPTQRWNPIIQERRISLARLRERMFPQIEIASTNPLFTQVCRFLDERMLLHLMARRSRPESKVSFNISVHTILDRIFDTFLSRIPEANRPNLMVELHCGEIFQDVSKSLAAIRRLREHGLGVIIDGVTLEFLPYARIDKIDHDYMKIMLPRGTVQLLESGSRIRAVRKLPLERVILSQCDHESAIQVGSALGIRLYQGWHLDQYHANPDS